MAMWGICSGRWHSGASVPLAYYRQELSHIEQATLDEVKSFFYRFYAPNNAVLAVTGNISWDETVSLPRSGLLPYPGGTFR